MVMFCMFFLLLACADSHGRPDGGNMFDVGSQRDVSWIHGKADIEGKLCAVGYMGATFYPERAREGASDQCRVQLAKSVQSRIVSMDVDWSSEEHGQYVAGSSVSATAMATDALIENVEIIDYFFDKDGRYTAGGGAMTYILCCVSERVINSLKK